MDSTQQEFKCTPVGCERDDVVVDEPVIDVHRIGHERWNVAAQDGRVAQDHVILRHVRRIRLQNHYVCFLYVEFFIVLIIGLSDPFLGDFIT